MKSLLQFLSDIFRFDRSEPNFVLRETPCENDIANPPDKIDDNSVISKSLDENSSLLKDIYRSDISNDLIIREFTLGKSTKAFAAFLNGLSSNESINDFILRDGMRANCPVDKNICEYAVENIFTIGDMKISSKLSDVTTSITDGLCVIFIDGEENCIIADTREYPQRSISASENEKSVYGPKEAFNENIRTNISLIRRHTHTDDLVCELRPCGQDSKTTIGILYRDGVASEELITEIKKRIAQIDVSDMQSVGILAQLTDASPLSPIPQNLLTEKPDRCSSYLHDGHVVLLCDGCPMASILPVTLFSLLSTAEDVYARPLIGGIMRIIRCIGALISITVPGVFIAIAMYHQGFFSSEILNTLISSRKMVFIPLGAELLLLLLVFQLVREAGMRVPGTVGQAIGIIGGLVLGQAVVAANLASSVVLILVALTGLGSFCIPDYTTQLSSTYFRIIFVIAGWMGGFLGLGCAFLIFTAYLSGLNSYGVPFLTPFAPKTHSKRRIFTKAGASDRNERKEDYMQ